MPIPYEAAYNNTSKVELQLLVRLFSQVVSVSSNPCKCCCNWSRLTKTICDDGNRYHLSVRAITVSEYAALVVFYSPFS